MGVRANVSAAAMVLVVLVGGACGTRVDRPGSATPTAAASGPQSQPAAPVQRAVEPVAAEAAWPASQTTVPGRPSPAVPVPDAVRGSAPGPTAATPERALSTAAAPTGPAAAPPGGSQPGLPSGPGQPPKPVPAGATPLVVASVGTQSGVVGSVVKPVLDAALVWVKDVNSRGGINGHPVKVLTYDDGGDPARHRAQVQEAVERRKVQAFFANIEVVTGKESVDYLTRAGIPVIGTTMGGDWGYDSPMYFQQGTAGHRVVYTGVAAAADILLPQGKKKLASLMCVEVDACDAPTTAASAKAVGFEHVYQGKASIAQPDFTAECLGARNAGADVFFLVMDTNSMTRVGAACARQGYRPTFASVTAVVADRLASDPNVSGMLASINVFPWFQTGTPATDAFHAAMKTYGRGLAPGVSQSVGWAAGKLLERAAVNLAEPPTTAALLDGLWSMKDETLGGLTPPLTFARGRPQQPRSCWFTIIAAGGRWQSADNYQTRCGSAPGD